MTPEREEALRLARNDPGSAGIFYATAEAQEKHEALLDALAADLEADEQKNEKLSALIVEQEGQYREERRKAERDLATARNGCEQALLLLGRKRFAEDAEAKVVTAVLRAALRSLGEKA